MTNAEITRHEVEALYSREAVVEPVMRAIGRACEEPMAMVRFLSRYANLNGWFGSGVAALAGKIGRSRSVFLDPEEPIEDIADRSVLVGSYFFDAARDEFDDRDTPHRDTHRCLAQACIKATYFYYLNTSQLRGHQVFTTVNEMLKQPLWLQGIGSRVATGYGVTTSDISIELFRSMGYHLGSEILADAEFSLIDVAMRNRLPALTHYLQTTEVEIAGQKHNGYAWIGLHSGHGASKEADHFAWATQGVNEALKYTRPENRDELRHQVHLGIGSFVRDHQEFFAHVSLD